MSVLVAASLGGLVAACSGGAPATGANASGTEKTAEAWAVKNMPGLPVDIVSAACKEGTLNLYHLIYRGALKPLIADFEKAFPCLKVTAFMASGSQLDERFTTEARAKKANGADVWMNTSPAFANSLADEGLLMDWTPPNSDRVPAEWKSEGHWYGVGIAPIGFAWNSKQVTAEQEKALMNITTWPEVANAPFKGRSAMAHIRAGGTTQLPFYYFRKDIGLDFWKKLKNSLNPVILDGANPVAGQLASGAIAFVPDVTTDTAIATQYLNGAPLKWRFPEPGLAVPHFIAISASASNPNAAKLFTAWSLTKAGQTLWVNQTGLAPMSADIQDNRKYAREPWYKLPTHYYTADWKDIDNSLAEMTKQFKTIFGQ